MARVITAPARSHAEVLGWAASVEQHSTHPLAAAITGGIAEALIATAFGPGIAITALIPFNFLNTKLDEASHEIESAATQLELIVHPKVLHPAPRVEPNEPARQAVAVAGKA